jgi:hypothetical protein
MSTKAMTAFLVVLVVMAFIGACIEQPRASSRAADDRRLCDAYCNAAKGDLVEMHNTPSTDSWPASPICVCAIGEPSVDVD